MEPYALILSNDVQDPGLMLDICKATAPYVDGVKIGITSSMIPELEYFLELKRS